MPSARLITFTPELAQTVARSLESAGYTVQFAAPDEHFDAPAELEINLDDPSAADSYVVTADGKEIPFSYDAVEREFVLAPAWKKLKQQFAPLIHAGKVIKARRVATPATNKMAPVATNEVLTQEALPPARAAWSRSNSELETTTLMDEPESALPLEAQQPFTAPELQFQSMTSQPSLAPLQEVEPVVFFGLDYFDGYGARKSSSHMAANFAEPSSEPIAEFIEVESTPEYSAPVQLEAVSSMDLEAILPSRTEATDRIGITLRAAAFKAVIAKHLAEQRETLSSVKGRIRTSLSATNRHDQAWKGAVPVAAVITLAFLLGWGAAHSNFDGPKSTAAANSTDVDKAAVSPLATVSKPGVAPKRAAAVQSRLVTRKHVRAAYDERDAVAEDVVVRHYPGKYPTKAVRAANQPVKRYSDVN